jgi:hypothetical protein
VDDPPQIGQGGGPAIPLANNGVAGVAKGVAGHPLIFFKFLYFLFLIIIIFIIFKLKKKFANFF